ncbi:MAG: DUF3298 and DUF4163 domain-containing protein [Candidatus Pacebacteria bacterium]|nr:DUF3298 and DUF4163 domain-containing protein [Candidatus Paceibacterota bacterium]MBP9851880.1 DUF3298 and DUF4163 domain-containing protein [Candidatus Paceibacterota bacterium]
MEKKTLGYILFAAAVLALILVVLFKPQRGLPVANEPMPSESLNILTKTDKKITKETANVSINVTYPEFENVPAVINSDIKSFIDNEVANIEKLVSEGMPDSVVTSYSFSTTYEVEQANTDYVSLVFTVNEYTGGAHPNQYFRTFNYDIDTGKELKLADLYPADDKYLSALKPKIKVAVHDELAKRLADAGDGSMDPDEMLFEDISKLDETAFQRFTFGTDYIRFFFSPYDIAPYAAGPIVVKVDR